MSTVIQRDTVTTVAMADAAHTLVIGTPASSSQTRITGRVLFVDPDSSGAGENLTLPAEADFLGWLMICNSGGETITVLNDAAGTVCTVATTECAIVACNGTTWYGGVVKTT